MHVPSALAPNLSRVVPQVVDVLHVFSTSSFRAVFPLHVLCVSCCVDGQVLGLSVVYHSKVEPRCLQSVLQCGVKNAQSATRAALYLSWQYRAACTIVRGLGFCTNGCVDARPLEDWPHRAKKEEVVPLSKLRSEDAQAALRGGGGGARQRHGDEISALLGIRAQDLMERSKEHFVSPYAHTIKAARLMRYLLKSKCKEPIDLANKPWVMAQRPELARFA